MRIWVPGINHKETRYQGHWMNVFSSTFAFKYWRTILVVVIVAALFMCYPLYEHYGAFSHPDYAILFTLNCLMFPQLVFLDGAREESPVETSEINEREHENLVDGLAWGYYFGYLKLVLPKLEKQIAASDQFRYKITMKKLFILLPKDCFIEDNIKDADDRVKWAGNIPESKINRGGIMARPYKHSVHWIEMPCPEGGVDEYHFVLEYATPLMTLYDMSKHAALSYQERDHQVVLFMRKLSYILENCRECKGKYELVFLSETDTKKIADVLVGMYKDAKRRLEMQVDAN